MKNPIHVAVIGVGAMGKNHARVYSELNGTKLVAVADIDETGAKIAEKYNCKFYKDYKEMLKKENIDAVSIAVPTKFHKEIAIDAINTKKHVLVEKPITDNINDAKEIIKAAKENNIKLMVGHVERFNPAVQRLKEIIDEGRLGKLTSMIARRVGLFPPRIKDANVIIDLAVHDIDIFHYLIGSEPKEVYSSIGKALIDKREDYAELFLKYNGITGFIQVNWITPIKIRNLSITGTKGYAELNYLTQELILYESNYKDGYDDFGDFIVKFGKPNKVEIGVEQKEPLKAELEHFIDCIKNNKEPSVNGEVALVALKIALRVVNANELKNKRVKI